MHLESLLQIEIQYYKGTIRIRIVWLYKRSCISTLSLKYSTFGFQSIDFDLSYFIHFRRSAYQYYLRSYW